MGNRPIEKEIDLDLVKKYIEKNTTDEENSRILQWLEESEDNPRYLAELMTNISVHSVLDSESLPDDTNRMLSRLNARIDSQNRKRPSAFMGFIVTSLAAAATVILAVLLWNNADSHINTIDNETASELDFYCVNNSTSIHSYILSDNTKVFLRPGSELRYDVSGIKDCRIAQLKGDAYFDVARDSLRPFIVKTESISVKVLGTAFTVTTKPGKSTDVVLERGKVRIISPDGVNLIDMKPDQKVIYDENSRILELETINSVAYVAQHFNLVRLEQVTVREIINTLESNFNVKIEYSCPHEDKRYFFNYLKTDSIEDIVEVLEFISESECNIKYIFQKQY